MHQCFTSSLTFQLAPRFLQFLNSMHYSLAGCNVLEILWTPICKTWIFECSIRLVVCILENLLTESSGLSVWTTGYAGVALCVICVVNLAHS